MLKRQEKMIHVSFFKPHVGRIALKVLAGASAGQAAGDVYKTVNRYLMQCLFALSTQSPDNHELPLLLLLTI